MIKMLKRDYLLRSINFIYEIIHLEDYMNVG